MAMLLSEGGELYSAETNVDGSLAPGSKYTRNGAGLIAAGSRYGWNRPLCSSPVAVQGVPPGCPCNASIAVSYAPEPHSLYLQFRSCSPRNNNNKTNAPPRQPRAHCVSGRCNGVGTKTYLDVRALPGRSSSTGYQLREHQLRENQLREHQHHPPGLLSLMSQTGLLWARATSVQASVVLRFMPFMPLRGIRPKCQIVPAQIVPAK
jgi:hypothetical protein